MEQAKGSKNQRLPISKVQVSREVTTFEKRLFERLKEKGYGSFASTSEIMGMLEGEYQEFSETHRQHKSEKERIHELTDIAVTCIFGIACIRNGTVDW